MTTHYPLAPLVTATGDKTIYDLADRLGLSHERIVALAARGLTEKQVEEYAVRRLRILPENVPGWRELWWAASELEAYVEGVPEPAREGKKE